jgi:hypothetical protein
MNKRGVSNIEFILAFILFMGFVVSALYFFNPVRSTDVMQSSERYTINKIITNTTVEIGSYSVKISDQSAEAICVEIEGVDAGKKARVEDYNGNELPSARVDNKVYFERDGKNFVVIHFSEDFEGGKTTSERPDKENNYQIASSTSSSVISEKRIRNLKDAYANDYSSLKTQLDIPPGVDFSFSLAFSNGTVIAAEKTTPLRAEVFSETKIEEALKSDGTSEFAYLTAKIW